MNPGSRRSQLGVRWRGVTVWLERFGMGHAVLKVPSAIELDRAEESGIYPYERPVLDADASTALASALTARPTVRRPRRITIAGQR